MKISRILGVLYFVTENNGQKYCYAASGDGTWRIFKGHTRSLFDLVLSNPIAVFRIKKLRNENEIITINPPY